MAKKIEWTESALFDRFKIYSFWLEHNKSADYSLKLELLFKETAKLISIFPEIGMETDMPGVRVKIVNRFKIFYTITRDSIRIIRVWDTKQDPDEFDTFNK